MGIFGYDPEAVYQEADILQRQYEEESREVAAEKRAGRCTHGWTLARGHRYTQAEAEAEHVRAGDFPDRPMVDATAIPEGKALCLDCGQYVADPLAGRR